MRTDPPSVLLGLALATAACTPPLEPGDINLIPLSVPFILPDNFAIAFTNINLVPLSVPFILPDHFAGVTSSQGTRLRMMAARRFPLEWPNLKTDDTPCPGKACTFSITHLDGRYFSTA